MDGPIQEHKISKWDRGINFKRSSKSTYVGCFVCVSERERDFNLNFNQVQDTQLTFGKRLRLTISSSDETVLKLIADCSTWNSSDWIWSCKTMSVRHFLSIKTSKEREYRRDHHHSNTSISALEPDMKLPFPITTFKQREALPITSLPICRLI